MKMVLAEELQNGMELAQDIFLSEDSASPFVSKGIVLNDYVIEKLRSMGIRSVYISDEAPYDPTAPEAVPKSKPALSPQLQQQALYTLENAFELMSLNQGEVHEAARQAVAQTETVVSHMVKSILDDRDTLVNINDLKSYDDYTYHHSLSVAVLSLSIGQMLSLNEDELRRLGLSAMMHDIGKTAIPVELINKTSRLNSSEFDLIKTHSSKGYSSLADTAMGDEDLWRAVLYHHEKLDGSGYPKGLKGADIPFFSRIITVADVYDALTSNRPYRRPMEPAEALEYVMGGSGTAFDFDMVKALVKKIDLYPVGSRVELYDGRLAEVIDNENQLRPVIKLEGTGDILDLFRDRNCLNIVIRRVVPGVVKL